MPNLRWPRLHHCPLTTKSTAARIQVGSTNGFGPLEEISHIERWLSMIVNVGLVLGVPTVVAVRWWMYRQRIAAYGERIEALVEQAKFLERVRADRIAPILREKYELELTQWKEKCDDLETNMWADV